MAYEAAVFWSGICGAIAIYCLWRLHNKKKKDSTRKKPAREVILEATTKRLTGFRDTTTENDESSGFNIVDVKSPLGQKETENSSSDIKEKRADSNLQSQVSFTPAKVNAEEGTVYKVKVSRPIVSVFN